VAIPEFASVLHTASGGLPMPDDKTKRPQDASKANVHEPYEVKYWTDKWKVTEQHLKDAVTKVGVMVKDVAKHLGKPHP
jgi:hypothetical protein